jgi:hypothetical protein
VGVVAVAVGASPSLGNACVRGRGERATVETVKGF